MKRTLYLLLGSMILAVLASSALAQSLGDVARQQRTEKKKPAVKVYTNDDLSGLDPDAVSVVGEPAPPPPDATTDQKTDAKSDTKTDTKSAPGDDKATGNDKIKGDIAESKKQIASLEHDIDIMQREYRLRAAAYYADAGNSLRDPKQWAEEDRKYQDDLKTKQDTLADAKQKLSDLQDQGRKAGMPSADIE